MAVYTYLKTLIRRTKESRTFITATTYSISNPPLAPLANPFFSLHSPTSRLLSPLSNWIIPLQGPLFLSFPPWKLSQSATPLYLQENGVVLRKIEALNLNLLRKRTSFPLKLKFGSTTSCAQIVSAQNNAEEENNEFVQSLVNLPNLISVGRLISGPVLGWMITNEWYSYATMGLAVSGATDWLDGYVARKMKTNSVVGSYLDPLADKVLIGCVALAMVQKDLLYPGLVGIVVFRDVALVGGAVYQRAGSLGWEWNSWYDFFNLDRTNPQKVEPLFISKLNTVFQLILVTAALLQPEFGTTEAQPYITYLSWLVASTTVASTAAYGVQYMRKGSAVVAVKSKS